MRPLLVMSFLNLAGCAGAVDYHLSPTGNDKANGKSPAYAWKTLEMASKANLEPGDRILFEGGKTFRGTLICDKKDRGKKGKPVTISSYGTGRATIDGGKETAILARNVRHFVISNIDVVGIGRKEGNTKSGVAISNSEHVTVQDVSASGFQKSGIAGWRVSYFRILRVHAHDNGGSGIVADGRYRNPDTYSRDLYIGYCKADDNPGDPTALENHSGSGIVFGGYNGALVEYCSATRNGWDMPRGGNGPVGIWCWQSDNAVFQYCIAHHNRSSEKGMDGGGFDLDGGVRNSVYQYCLSYENHGPGYLMYQYDGASDWEDNTVRYCISINDGWHNTHGALLYGAWGKKNMSNLMVYNNFFYNDRKAILQLRVARPAYFANNILMGNKGYFTGKLDKARFHSNRMWNPDDPEGKAALKMSHRTKMVGKIVDPRVVLPKNWDDLPTDPEKLKDMKIFRLLEDSPCAGAGVRIDDAGEQDFFGNPLPRRDRPSIGIHQAK